MCARIISLHFLVLTYCETDRLKQFTQFSEKLWSSENQRDEASSLIIE